MNTTDLTERGLEGRICAALTGLPCEPDTAASADGVRQRPAVYGAGWICGDADDYDREHCVDLRQLVAFLADTQPRLHDAFALDEDGPTRRKFLARLQAETARRGTVDVLRKGLAHGPHHVDLFFGTPSAGNETAAALHDANRFSVTRQLRYGRDGSGSALDLALFVNGLPVATFELKNSLTKQTVDDAVHQYRRDRDPHERLFEQGRCVAHFAVDEHEVKFCTHLRGKASWFLPFNMGWDDGAGNPPNPDGLKTDYLWRRVLTRESLTDVLENYAHLLSTKDHGTGRRTRTQIWPRYHQLGVVRALLADARRHGAGRRYLIQHSAGSGKSNSIAWLTHQLIGLAKDDVPVFDSVIVVTDRRILDRQIRDTVKQFAQVGATVGHAERSGDLRRFIEGGKKIVISTVQKFPFILDEIGNQPPGQGPCGRRFAIIIDEAHSSQGGRTSAAMSQALSATGAGAGDDAEAAPAAKPEAKTTGGDASSAVADGETVPNGKAAPDAEAVPDGDAAPAAAVVTEEDDDEGDTFEDHINRLMETRRLLPNASYFAFTATPKNKTLEIFGEPAPQPDGTVKHLPFHVYTMKQAIQEGFILDVLASFTPVRSYYRLARTVEDDPEFDTGKAQKKLRRYVESHGHAIRLKAGIMVDHFHEQVLAPGKIGRQARAMVVAGSVDRAIRYHHAIGACLAERKSPYRAIVAFSGEREFGGAKVSEASLNGFPSSSIAGKLREDPYRFLICADKFQTGYDEPLLHTMYVDKILSGIKAVQTLSRLNRAHPKKHDVFVLDFMNDADTIRKAFEPYYRATVLADETDPDKLHDLQADLDGYEVYSQADVDRLVRRYLEGASRDRLDPILDACVAAYRAGLDEDAQVAFKGKAKGFVRTWGFLSMVLPWTNAEWEKRSIFLNLLVPKLPAPREEDLSRGILEAIDMDSYRAEKRLAMRIRLPDQDGEIAPVPAAGGGGRPEPELDRLSNIIAAFNERFGNIPWEDADRVHRLITEEIPARVAADSAYRNARERSDRQNARIELDKALSRVMTTIVNDDTQLFRHFADDEGFRRWLTDAVFDLTCEGPVATAR